MFATVFKYYAILNITLFFNILLNAQPVKGNFIDASVGYALSVPYDDYNNYETVNSGFYLEGEYVLAFTNWFGLRPYAGLIMTFDTKNGDNQTNYQTTSKALIIGGKVRLVAPIPYVAPYVELGLGASIGTFETYTSTTRINRNGVLVHIPVSIGLAIGRNHDFDIGFGYYYHPIVEQFSGAVALGVSFPIN